MTTEDLRFVLALTQSEIYNDSCSLVLAAIDADDNAADELLFSLGLTPASPPIV